MGIYTTPNLPKKKNMEIVKKNVEPPRKDRTYCRFLFIDLCSCQDHTAKNVTSPIPTFVQNIITHLGILFGNKPDC